jgi:hypothetical protein
MTGAVEAFFNSLAKYSWRTLLGVFVTAGAVLFFNKSLKIESWEQSFRGYLIAAFILSGVVLTTHLITTIQERVVRHHEKRLDLRMVAKGGPLHSHWSLSLTPLDKKPMMTLITKMSFALFEDATVILQRGYMKGTTEAFTMSEIRIDDGYEEHATICLNVTPVKAKPGKDLKARLVFVDQYNYKHITEKITFRPNTMPDDFIKTKILANVSNCVFCGQPVTFGEQAKEAQMTAHTNCIWR